MRHTKYRIGKQYAETILERCHFCFGLLVFHFSEYTSDSLGFILHPFQNEIVWAKWDVGIVGIVGIGGLSFVLLTVLVFDGRNGFMDRYDRCADGSWMVRRSAELFQRLFCSSMAHSPRGYAITEKGRNYHPITAILVSLLTHLHAILSFGW